MSALELPDDLRQELEAAARQRGLPVDAMMLVALREWLGESQRQQVIASLVAQGGFHLGVARGDAPDWRPVELPGRPLSEIVMEERGAR